MTDIYSHMIELLQDQLTKTGIPQISAISASASVVERLRNDMGGRDVYLPRRHPWRGRTERDFSIRAEFNGRNLDEICRKHALSRASIYRICRKK